ncbi:hypothetical protein MHEC_23720 [Mycobacterium heckeshornense]|uniref:Uncharacterized protein n=1 Tax=Mycobacterium heckeshornense TaxID=110505 RepID=A0A7R7GV06_9MYCO|nr:hypothetical protein MHEC_23720 [Mycobacterium heckeshornense]
MTIVKVPFAHRGDRTHGAVPGLQPDIGSGDPAVVGTSGTGARYGRDNEGKAAEDRTRGPVRQRYSGQ